MTKKESLESEEQTDESQESEIEQAPEETEESEEESEETEESSENIDYTAELEEAKERLRKAGHKIEQLKKEKKERREEYVEPAEPVGEDRTREIIREETQSLRRDISRGSAQVQAESVSHNDDEKKLIMFHYENSIVLTGNVEEDIERAQVLANKRRVNKELSEAYRALRSQGMKGKAGEPGQRKQRDSNEPEVSKENRKLLSRMKAKWNPKKNGWITPSGKFIDLEKAKSAPSYNA